MMTCCCQVNCSPAICEALLVSATQEAIGDADASEDFVLLVRVSFL